MTGMVKESFEDMWQMQILEGWFFFTLYGCGKNRKIGSSKCMVSFIYTFIHSFITSYKHRGKESIA